MITLRAIDPENDAAALHAVFGDEAACRYLPDPALTTIEETRAKLEQWSGEASDTDWAVTLEANDEVVGRVTIYEKPGGVWEAGVMIVPKHHRKGFAALALQQAIDLIDERWKPRRIEADIDPDNAASLNLFRSLGFQQEGRLRARWSTHIGVRDTDLMALIDTDPRPWRG